MQWINNMKYWQYGNEMFHWEWKVVSKMFPLKKCQCIKAALNGTLLLAPIVLCLRYQWLCNIEAAACWQICCCNSHGNNSPLLNVSFRKQQWDNAHPCHIMLSSILSSTETVETIFMLKMACSCHFHVKICIKLINKLMIECSAFHKYLDSDTFFCCFDWVNLRSVIILLGSYQNLFLFSAAVLIQFMV